MKTEGENTVNNGLDVNIRRAGDSDGGARQNNGDDGAAMVMVDGNERDRYGNNFVTANTPAVFPDVDKCGIPFTEDTLNACTTHSL